MNVTEANDLNTVLLWAMGKPHPYSGPVTDDEATGAGQRLATRAYKRLMAGLRPDEVVLSRGSDA